jgi:enamine deaminase RidA (YjgF/YER057c/UK114 family)
VSAPGGGPPEAPGGPESPGSPSPHGIVNPAGLAPPAGFSHAVVAVPGRTVYLAGQIGAGADGRVAAAGLVEQFDLALGNLLTALAAAGGRPEQLVWLQIFVTDVAAYRGELRRLGEGWRRHLGLHYPATALLEVRGLFDPAALVELMGIAVIPEYR